MQTAEELFGADVNIDLWTAAQMAGLMRVPIEDAAAAVASTDIAADAPLEAFENHGRLLVQCDECHSAQLAFGQAHRFMCVECGNRALDGRWRPVIWPEGLT